MTKTFFTKTRAEEYAEELKQQKYKVQIWTDTDGFGQIIYIVKW